MTILRNLEYAKLIEKVWHYFTINDIIQLLRTNKDLRNMSIRVNSKISCEIKIRTFEGQKKLNVENKERLMIVINFLNTFPNISKLTFMYTWYNLVPHGERKELGLGTTIMSLLYYNLSFKKNVRELIVRIRDDKAFIGIRNFTNMTLLDISDSGITNISELGLLTNLTSLNISQCRKMKSEGLLFLYPLVLLQELFLSRLYLSINDLVLSQLEHLTNLTILDISYSTNITDRGMLYISKLKMMKKLILSDCYHITDTCLSYISLLPNLTYLDLDGCDDITNYGLNYLSVLTNITFLNLSKCLQITDIGFSYLTTLTNLTILNVSQCKISDEQINNLCLLKSIKSLTIMNCSNITNKGLNKITQSLINLESFTFTWFFETVDCNAITYIYQLPNFEHLEIKLQRYTTTKAIYDKHILHDIIIDKLVSLNTFIIPEEFKETDGVKGLAYVRKLRICNELIKLV